MDERERVVAHEIAVILLGRGGIGSAAKTELTALALVLQQACLDAGWPVQSVTPAFVDRSAPSLPEALAQCSAQSIVVVPAWAPDEPALRRWLNKVIQRWLAARASGTPETHPATRVWVSGALLSTDGVAALLVPQIRQALGGPDVETLTQDDDWPHDPVAWSEVPAHQHHVLWCTGPRCAAKGALSLWPELGKVVREHPVLKRDVQLLQTSCQYPCNHGPLMIVYPQGAWYGQMTAAALRPVLEGHVVGGVVDAAHCVHGPMLYGSTRP